MAKPLSLVNGVPTEIPANTTSAGAADAGKLVQLDSTGHLDSSTMPVGLGANTVQVQASENLSAGAFVNVWSSAGASRARNADGSTTGKTVDGYVLTAVTSGANATVYPMTGANTQLSGLTPGAVYFLSTSTPGGVQTTTPAASGGTSQRVGVAVSATSILSESCMAYGTA